jgi:hypothetical protein
VIHRISTFAVEFNFCFVCFGISFLFLCFILFYADHAKIIIWNFPNYSSAEDDDEELASKKKGKDEWTAPKWTQGLIVKPDEKHLKGQLRLWGILTAIGIALPPAQDYLGRFTWLVCVAQLTFRGMPQETREGGGMGMAFNMSSRGGHRKIAFAIGFLTWIVGAIVAYGMMPTWARGQRWTSSAAFTIQNLIFGLVSSYLQPYKG